MSYYKATQSSGRDFFAGTIDYGAALVSGEVIRHPAARMVRDKPATYLSISTSPSDCTGFSWPCRLFRVEPVGRVMGGKVPLRASPNKRACHALRVVEELPAWKALGPNGEAVVALIERARRLSADELDQVVAALTAAQAAALHAAEGAAWDAAREAALAAAWVAACAAAEGAAWDAARAAARVAAWDAAREAARAAARALIVRDLITPEQFDILTKPWRDAGLPL